MIAYNIKINLQSEREQYENIVFTTGDKHGYRLNFDFYSNGKKMDVSKHALTVKTKRSDGAVIIDSGTVNADGAYYVVADNAYAVPGALEMEIALVGKDGSLATTVVLGAQVREGFGESGLSSADNQPIVAKLEAQYMENRAALNAHKSDVGAHGEALARERSDSNQQYANAIRGTVSGVGVIQADDVSPLEHTVKVKVSQTAGGENLFDVDNANGVIFRDEDDNETSRDDYDHIVLETFTYENGMSMFRLAVQPRETYKISAYVRDAYTWSESSIGDMILMVNTSEEIGLVEGDTLGTLTIESHVDTWMHDELSFTVPDNVTSVYLYASEYIAYKDIVLKKESPPLTVCGKNLFDSSKLLQATGWTENNGVYSGLPSYTTSLYGIASENGLMTGVFLPNTQYTFSFTGYSVGASTSKVGITFGVQYDDGTSDVLYVTTDSATKYVFTSDENKTIVRMNTGCGYNLTTYLSNIQLEKGAVATEYEPYAATTYTPNADGTCEIPSASPSMAVMTDEEGIHIDMEYNRDTNAVIREMANAIIALGGTL